MKSLIAAAMLTALPFLLTSLAAEPWTNEPAGSSLILDFAFNPNTIDKSPSQQNGVMWGNYGSGRFASDATAPYSPSNVMISSLAAGASTGGSEVHYYTPNYKPYGELFVGLWWRSNPEFQGRSGGNKLFWVKGPNCYGVFVIQGGLSSGSGPLVWTANAGVNNSHACGGDAIGSLCYPNVGNGTLRRGVWTKIEVYMKGSATSTSKDGIVRWWVNGVLAGNYTNLNNPGPLNEWMWSETWDGCGGNAGCDLGRVNTAEWTHYVDHLYISAPSCGAGGCVAPAYLVITSSLTPARTGTPYLATLAADGGTKPYTWFLNSGNLPAGLTLNQSTGVISGTPTCAGRSDFTIRVTDGSNPALTTTKSYTVITSGTCTSALRSNIAQNAEAAAFRVKAAPGKVTFNLPVMNAAQYQVSIYDLTGKKIYEHRSLGQKETSLTKDLKDGVYLARIVHGSKVESIRFQVIN